MCVEERGAGGGGSGREERDGERYTTEIDVVVVLKLREVEKEGGVVVLGLRQVKKEGRERWREVYDED